MKLVSIVGAGRSGTNLLAWTFGHESSQFKNLLENRYVWSYGQRRRSIDNRDAADANERVCGFIRDHFQRQMAAPNQILIDKTPSNALRIPFVAAVMPEAKIINIIRDGRDNVVSRTRQWEGQRKGEDASVTTAASLSGKLRIIGDRARHISTLLRRGNLPLRQIPAMVGDYAPALGLHLLTGKPRRYAERVAGLSHVREMLGLDAAAAVQWREVVMTAHVDGSKLGPDRYLEVRYERLVNEPVAVWNDIMAFVGVEPTGAGAAYLEETIRPQGKPDWLDGPARARTEAVEAHLRPSLEYLGYDWASGRAP